MALNDKDLLNKIRKLLSEATDTSSLRQPWQELLGREELVQARNVQAQEAVRGFVGSWAAAYTYLTEEEVRDSLDGELRGLAEQHYVPAPITPTESRLGLAGHPEIDFVPYAANTNQSGVTGAALIGQPISFSVVGPTKKSEYVDWAWKTSNGWDLNLVGSAKTVPELYGTIDLNEKPAFVIVSDPGGYVKGSIHYGWRGDSLGSKGMRPVYGREYSARYEAFRISRIADDSIFLDTGKNLLDYFEPTDGNLNTDYFGSITVIQPEVTKVAELPGSGGYKYAILQPTHASRSDYWMPWDEYVSTNGPAAAADTYKGDVPLPFLRPGAPASDGKIITLVGAATVQPDVTPGKFPADHTNVWEVWVTKEQGIEVGMVLNFHQVRTEYKNVLMDAPTSAMLGFFYVSEITELTGTKDALRLKRLPDVNPATGKVTHRASKDFYTRGGAYFLNGTVHRTLEDVYADYSGDLDAFDTARLTGLLDPKQIGRSSKTDGSVTRLAGFSPNRADRAAFDTTPGNDPGNFMDLGFRVVLYPATQDGKPDWNNPIDTNEVVIDPSLPGEDQWVEVDYASGIITLSHPVPVSHSGDLNPNGTIGLYASCVPYTQEGAQRGPGIRVTGGSLDAANLGHPVPRQRDVLAVDMSNEFEILALQTAAHGGDVEAWSKKGPLGTPLSAPPSLSETGFLKRYNKKSQLPYTDTIDISIGGGQVGYRGYTVQTDAENPGLWKITFHKLFGMAPGATFTFDADTVLRQSHRPDIHERYTTRGSTVRSETLRFDYADLKYNTDGSVSVLPTHVAGPAQELRAWGPLGSVNESGRFYLSDEHRWTTDDPTWYPQSHADDPNRTFEVGLEVSRGRLYTSQATNLTMDMKRVGFVAGFVRYRDGEVQIGPAGSTPFQLGGISGYEVDEGGVLKDNTSNVVKDTLCAVIEGSIITSKNLQENPFEGVPGGRVTVNLKNYETSWRQAGMEGPANPIDWRAVSVRPDHSVLELADDLRVAFGQDQFAALQGGADLKSWIPTDQYRLLLAGRQISMMPRLPYIQSGKLSTLTFTKDAAIGITLRSADAKYPSSWISFTLVLPAAVYADEQEIALTLNRCLVDESMGDYYVGDALDNAGFKLSRRVSQNPDLAALGLSERQILFIGNNDPRLLMNGIGLICSGMGTGHDDDTFINVVVDIHEHGNQEPLYNLAATIGGGFIAEGYMRAGLFDGTDSFNGGREEILVGAGTKWSNIFEHFGSSHSQYLGFDSRGFDPLGVMVGAHKIKEAGGASYVCTANTVQRPGPQAGGGTELDQNRPSDRPKYGKSYLPEAWPGRAEFSAVDWSLDEAGFVGAYISFGSDTFDEYGFKCHLMDQSKGYPSWVVRMTTEDVQHELPYLNWDDIAPGDMLKFPTQFAPGAVEGRILEIGKTPIDATTTQKWMTVLVKPVSAYIGQWQDSVSQNYWQGAAPKYYGGAIQPYEGTSDFPKWFMGSSLPTMQPVAIKPSVSGLAAHRLIAEHLGDVPNKDRDLFGLATPNSLIQESFTMIGAGRLALYSPVGWNEPSGIVFSSPSREDSSAKVQTYLEAGVFTTDFSIGMDGKSSGSAGVFDYFGSKPVGRYGTKDELVNVGGVGGLRVSGDAQIWLKRIRPLLSEENTAFVRRYKTQTDTFIDHLKTGAVTPASRDLGSGHSPSGWTPGQDGFTVTQEATVHLALTETDYRTVRDYAQDPLYPFYSGEALGTTGGAYEQGRQFLDMGQRVSSAPRLVGSLKGKFLLLSRGGPDANAANDGIWEIVDAPLLMSTDKTPQVAPGTSTTGEEYAIQRSRSLSNPYYPNPVKGDPKTGDPQNQWYNIDHGHVPARHTVAILEVRIKRTKAVVPGEYDLGTESFVPDFVGAKYSAGFQWAVFEDSRSNHLLYVADVVDPGGSPTGAPQSFRGLTLDPYSVAGKNSLPMTIHPIWPTDGTRIDNDNRGTACDGELLGIHDTLDIRGRHVSRAVLALPTASNVAANIYRRYRMTVHSSLTPDLEMLADADTKGQFEVDESGRINFVGMPRRLGPGVLMDGGLGMVQAQAFRAAPRPIDTDDIGALTVYGRGAYPIHNYLNKVSQVGQNLPSVFNQTEFYDTLTVAVPGAGISLQNAWAAEGLVTNWFAVMTPNLSNPGPGNLARFRNPNLLSQKEVTYAGPWSDGIPANDTIFAQTGAGIRFKSPGTVVYERAFRSIDATGHRAVKTMYHGTTNQAGIPGMEVPTYGECLLLPQGPPTLNSHGGHQGVKTYGGVHFGQTPLDLPLYEFTNAASVSVNRFGINAAALFSGSTAFPNANSGHQPHLGSPGEVYSAYRHSFSREDEDFYGADFKLKAQVRLLDGMVVEDVENGTFYSVGDIGRWRPFNEVNGADLGRPGDTFRPSTVGSMTSIGASLNADAEILYDLGRFCDPLANPILAANLDNGFGDRVDDGTVRRPLAGHKIRITPNVEFVPVMGPRGVTGSLVPPRTQSKGILGRNYDGADAIFFDADYNFKPMGQEYGQGDVGKMLYICGTDEYRYTGWWVIIDVALGDPGLGYNKSFAYVRKLKGRGIEPVQGYDWNGNGAFPMGCRGPVVRSISDRRSNDRLDRGHFNGIAGEYGSFSLWVHAPNAPGSQTYMKNYGPGILGAAGITDATSAAAWLNTQDATNGKECLIAMGVADAATTFRFISWISDPNSNTLSAHVTKKEFVASGNEELWERLFAHYDAGIKVDWRTRVDLAHAGPDSYDWVGFFDEEGHSASVDCTMGDRNNYRPMKDPMGGEAYSAAKGLRWVFSSPLTEEHTGSYLHLTRPRIYRFGRYLKGQEDGTPISNVPYMWTSGHARKMGVTGGSDVPNYGTEIFRINRCPSTANIILGGDCEVYHPELITDIATLQEPGVPVDAGGHRPVMYSPLSVAGNWQDTKTGALPNVGSWNSPIQYALQPIGREKIVTVNPTAGRSNMVMGRGMSDNAGFPYGPQGVGPAIVSAPTSPAIRGQGFSLAAPWQLVGRHDVIRTNMAEPSGAADFDQRVELGNSNNPDPNFGVSYPPGTLPRSTYCWSPGGEWWQMYQPGWATHGPDASAAPPTLRMDLTEAFTQAMGPGSGINSPHPDRIPRGVRLNRLWVNFGLWGNEMMSRSYQDTPGFKGGLGENEVLYANYMAFNLIVEIPGSQARTLSGDKPLNSGTSGFPFGDRVPTATRTHGDNSDDSNRWPGGTIVVPLYVNREAGDMMPNVMERFVSVGPVPAYNKSHIPNEIPPSDWDMGHYEFGFGCGSRNPASMNNHINVDFTSNSFNPVLWGGIDFALAIDGGPFMTAEESLAMHSPFPRASRVGGGVRSMFSSGLVGDGSVFSQKNAYSLSAAAMTGIVVTHSAMLPGPARAMDGSYHNDSLEGPTTCPHAFTMALTPVGDAFFTPKDPANNRTPVGVGDSQTQGDTRLRHHGRTLFESAVPTDWSPRKFRVGNWLDMIIERYNIPVESGSMLPPGSRVFLEVAAGPGTAGWKEDVKESVAAGTWLGSVKLSFDVETAHGTAWSQDVNILGDEEG